MKFFLVICIGVFAVRTFNSRDAVSNSLDMIAFMVSIGTLIAQL